MLPVPSHLGTGNSVMTPAGVLLPMLSACPSANHRFPSGPVVILGAELLLDGVAKVVIVGVQAADEVLVMVGASVCMLRV